MPAQREQQLQLTTTGITTFITGAATPGTQCLYPMRFKAVGTTLEALLKIYIYNGTTRTLLKEIYVPAVTASTIVPSWEGVFQDSTIFLATASWLIQVEMSLDFGAVDCTATVWDI